MNHCILRGPPRTILLVGPLRGRGEDDSCSLDRARGSGGGNTAVGIENTAGEEDEPVSVSSLLSLPSLLLLLPGRRDGTVKCFVCQPEAHK